MQPSIVLQLTTGKLIRGVRFVAVHQGGIINLEGVTSMRLVGVYCLPPCTAWAIERLQRACILHGEQSPSDPGHEGMCWARLTYKDGGSDVLLTTLAADALEHAKEFKLLTAQRSLIKSAQLQPIVDTSHPCDDDVN